MACACTHVARAAHDDAADETACEHGVLRLLDDYSSDEARNAANDGALLDGVGAHGGELLHRIRRRLLHLGLLLRRQGRADDQQHAHDGIHG